MIRTVSDLRRALSEYPDDMKFIFPQKLSLSKHGRDFFDDEAEAKAEYEKTDRIIEAGWHKDGYAIYSARFEGLSIHDDIYDLMETAFQNQKDGDEDGR